MAQLNLEQLVPRVTKAELIRLVEKVGGLDGQRIGKIELGGGRASIQVPGGWEGRLAKRIDGHKLHGRRLTAWASDSGGGARNQHGHLQKLAQLVELEREAEAQRAIEMCRRLSPADAERAGHSLVDLMIVDEDAGLGGRYLVKLAKRQRARLPWTRLGVGSPVVLTAQDDAQIAARGVVYARRDDRRRPYAASRRSRGRRAVAARPVER